ncbi:MAG TPA: efflux RND transporter periplasmic adaptor subunit [Sphingomonas sp.]
MRLAFADSGRRARIASGLALGLALAACGNSGNDAKHGHGDQGPAEVGYVIAQKTSAPVVTELAGRTSAYQTSEVRPQVSGLIKRRYFVEGSLVHKGDPLYQIDPSLYRASADQASANLASAQANAEATRIKADRYKPLAAEQAVAQQDYTDALASARQAAATVKQNQAALETAKINLRFTTVPAPITGRIGRSLFTVGALVTQSQTDPLAVIQQTDPMYVDIQQSSTQLLALRQSLAQGGVMPTTAVVHLKLEDGSDYGYTGTVEFTEVTVDQSTGTVTMRARFPNPQGLLLPGMFVRASFAQAIDTSAVLVPQAAVTRDPKGNATVFIVGPGNKALQRTVTADRTQGTYWVVTDGLNAGDKVIVQGTSKITPNAPIKPVPANQPQILSPSPRGQSGSATAKQG